EAPPQRGEGDPSSVGGQPVVREGPAAGHLGVGDADEQGGAVVGAPGAKVVADGVVGVVGQVHGAVLAALAEDPETLGPDVRAVESDRLADPAAGGDEEVDEGP